MRRTVLPRGVSGLLLAAALVSAAVPLVAQDRPLPVTGKPDARFSAFDDVMRDYMTKRGIRAAALAVRWRNNLAYERGYGWRDEGLRAPLPATTRFRLGPLSQVLTFAAVERLVEAGKLRRDQSVFELLKPEAVEGRTPDPELSRITVDRLLSHRSGWDFTETYDPLDDPWRVAEALKIDAHPTAEDFVRFAAGQPLTTQPGARRHDSGLDAILLGRVVEKVAGKPYADYVRSDVLTPLKITAIEPARPLAADRRRDEAWYVHPTSSRPAVAGAKAAAGADGGEEASGEVPGAYGGVDFESRLAADGWLGSAASFALVMDSHGPNGRKPLGHEAAVLQGALPGSYAVAIWRKDTLRIVALFNHCTDGSGEPYDVIGRQLDEAADKVRRQLRD